MPLQPALIDPATGKLYRHTPAGFTALVDEPDPLAPIITVSGPTLVSEGDAIALTAAASDEDGVISSYVWTQTAGPTATILSGAGTSELVAVAPAVAVNSVLTFSCTVTDDDGLTAQDSHSVTVEDVPVVVGDTWADAGLLWANAPPTYEYSASRLFANADLHSRNFAPLTDEYSYTARVTCGVSGWPVDGTSFARVFLASMLPSDAGEYLFEFTGTAASLTTYSNCSISDIVVSGGKTTGKLTIGASAVTGGIKFNNVSGFSGLKIMRPGLALSHSGLLRPAAATHLATFSGLRFLDLLETNDSTEAAEVNWSTARAAQGADPVGYKNSLKACFDIAAVNGQDAWVLVSAAASDAHISSFVSACASLRASGQRVIIEYSNERWNSGFKAWSYCGIAACDAANTRTGNPGQTGRILSAVRAGGVVTVVFNSAHGITAGTTIYRGGLTGLSSGAVAVASTPDANTLTWAEAGDDATATLATSFNSYIHLNLSHSLTARLTAWGNPNTYPTAYIVKERWELSRLKVIYDAIAAASQTANIKAVMGVQVGASTTPGVLAWAKQVYGSTAWIDSVAPAYYAYPANSAAMTTVDAVFQQLEADLPAKLASLLRQRNGAKTFGVRMTAYEGGPHTHSKPNETVNAAIAAAHVDDRMRLLGRRLMDEYRAIGADEFAWFAAGAAASFGGTANNTWPLVLGDLADGPNQAKYKAMIEQAAASATPAPRDGQTWGAIPLGTYLATDIGGLGGTVNRVIGTTEGFGDLVAFVCAPADGTYTLVLQACQSTAAGHAVTVLVDGVSVAGPTTLPVQTPTSGGSIPQALSASVTLTKGGHDVAIRLPGATRTASIGLGQLILS